MCHGSYKWRDEENEELFEVDRHQDGGHAVAVLTFYQGISNDLI